jgi:hypothetical protein
MELLEQLTQVAVVVLADTMEQRKEAVTVVQVLSLFAMLERNEVLVAQ